MAAPNHRSSTFDGLRGAAAAAVLLFHGGTTLDRPWMVGHGALAVDVFFALSGVVVDRAYGARLRAGWPWQDFAAVRFARLYPMYLAGTALALALRSAEYACRGRIADIGGLALVASAGALLLPLFRGNDRPVFPLDPPGWSLLVEAVMNAGLAALPRWRPRLAAAVVAAAAAALLFAALEGVPLLNGGASRSFWVDFARGAFGFGCGLLISRAEASGRLTGLARLRGRWAALLAAAALGALLVPRGPADAWFDPAGILLVCPAVVALAAARPQVPGRLRGLCFRAGALSYPLYLVHAPLLSLAVTLASPAGASGTPAAAGAAAGIAAAMTASVALAAAVAFWAEPALKRAFRRTGPVALAMR